MRLIFEEANVITNSINPVSMRVLGLRETLSFCFLWFTNMFLAVPLSMALVEVLESRAIAENYSSDLISALTYILDKGVLYSLQAALVAFTILYYSCSRKSEIDIRQFGFKKVEPKMIVFSLGIGALAGCCLLLLYYFDVFRVSSNTDSEILGNITISYLNFLSILLMTVIFIPVVEECFFRGVLFLGFARVWGSRSAISITSILFVLIHTHFFDVSSLVPLAFLVVFSFFCAILRARTNSILPSIFVHGAYNLILGIGATLV